MVPDDELSDLPFMSSPVPILALLLAYLLFVLVIGPKLMEKRRAFELNSVLIIYNVFQVIVAAYLVYRIIIDIWLYLATKVTELMDTVFFVLRKKNKQITFLHLYHHSAMVFTTWAFLKYAPSDNVIYIGFSNSLVHVFMYTYYALSAVGPEAVKYLFWKKYMTSLQMIQFVSMFVHYLISLMYSECPPSKGVAVFFVLHILFFLYLFANFYSQSYNKNKKLIEGIWLYFAAKVTELLDTVFFVLRKKDNQVSFLHLYHHSIMMTGTWAFLKYAPSDNVIFIGFFNSLVHVFMYTYYGLAALGPHVAKYLTWKKYMTSFQLLQFVSVFFQYLASLKFSECPPSKGVAIFFTFQIIFFLVLFSNFYKQSYTQKQSKLANGGSKLVSNGKTKEEKVL
ncbi:unnamed protein product [Plutella xylostella]|uniref:Elongation of very long chain fatty acids protein n=1 Tax=Plutella xylostella TaxID=51655 RepID=A0A8S4EID0_PLUXY|nr:unnamed protein product [Plutella xylostella]